MIVRELIEALSKCDPDAEVWNELDTILITSVVEVTCHAGGCPRSGIEFNHVRIF